MGTTMVRKNSSSSSSSSSSNSSSSSSSSSIKENNIPFSQCYPQKKHCWRPKSTTIQTTKFMQTKAETKSSTAMSITSCSAKHRSSGILHSTKSSQNAQWNSQQIKHNNSMETVRCSEPHSTQWQGHSACKGQQTSRKLPHVYL